MGFRAAHAARGLLAALADRMPPGLWWPPHAAAVLGVPPSDRSQALGDWARWGGALHQWRGAGWGPEERSDLSSKDFRQSLFLFAPAGAHWKDEKSLPPSGSASWDLLPYPSFDGSHVVHFSPSQTTFPVSATTRNQYILVQRKTSHAGVRENLGCLL